MLESLLNKVAGRRAFLYRTPSVAASEKSFSEKFYKLHEKAPASEFHFNSFAGKIQVFFSEIFLEMFKKRFPIEHHL